MLSSTLDSHSHAPDGGVAYRFEVRAAQDPHAAIRVAGLLSQRGITPDELHSQKSGPDLLIRIDVTLEDEKVAQILLEKIRTLVLVHHAHVMERPL